MIHSFPMVIDGQEQLGRIELDFCFHSFPLVFGGRGIKCYYMTPS